MEAVPWASFSYTGMADIVQEGRGKGYDRVSRVEIKSERKGETGWWSWRGGVDVKGSKMCIERWAGREKKLLW